MSKYFNDFGSDEEISHYGVKGMKWRKGRKRNITEGSKGVKRRVDTYPTGKRIKNGSYGVARPDGSIKYRKVVNGKLAVNGDNRPNQTFSDAQRKRMKKKLRSRRVKMAIAKIFGKR